MHEKQKIIADTGDEIQLSKMDLRMQNTFSKNKKAD